MERRWLRENPHLPGNPPGRGVALLQRLETVSTDAKSSTELAWREARSHGLTTNQISHLQEQIAKWDQLDPQEHETITQVLRDGNVLHESNFDDLRFAEWTSRWAGRIRQTNASINAVEMRIEERRAHLARLEEAAASAASGDGEDHAVFEQAQHEADGAVEEIAALCQRSRQLQIELVQDLLASGLTLVPDLMRELVREGLFHGAEIQEYRDFAHLILEAEQA